MAELYYIWKKRIQHHGFNDGNEVFNQPDLLLTITNDPQKAKEFQQRFEFEFYKKLEQSLLLSGEQIKNIGSLFDQPVYFSLSAILQKLSITDFKKLQELIGIDFTMIRSCEPEPKKFYPLLNHHLLMKAGLETMNHMELEDIVDNLSGPDPDEAFEKGLFLLLLMNFLPQFVGDPETTAHEAELERHQDHLVKMREIFQPPADLISKHGCMKFWLVEKGYPRYGETFPDFFTNKEMILGDNLWLFNKLAAFFKAHKEKVIYVVNVC
jgi:hypothetical protein